MVLVLELMVIKPPPPETAASSVSIQKSGIVGHCFRSLGLKLQGSPVFPTGAIIARFIDDQEIARVCRLTLFPGEQAKPPCANCEVGFARQDGSGHAGRGRGAYCIFRLLNYDVPRGNTVSP
jgi:hypothetical protein